MSNFQANSINIDEENVLRKLFMQVQKELAEEVGQLAFKSWLSLLDIYELKNNILYLSLPSSFLSDWVIPHYGNKIDRICKKSFKNITKTKIIVCKNSNLKGNTVTVTDLMGK